MKMNSLILITLNLLLIYVIATTFGKSESFKEYQHTKTHRYSSTLLPFRRLFGLSHNVCMYQCSIRKRCKSLNYKRKSQTCELNDATGAVEVNKEEPSVYMERSDIKDNSCGCDDKHVCTDTKIGKCSIEECEPLTNVDNGKIYGNMNRIGSKLKVTCNSGYEEMEGRMYTTCLTNGNWQFIPNCVRNCGTPIINNAVVTTSRGTLFEAVGTVSCEDGYTLSVGSQITCQADASWTTGPTCTIKDCGTPSIDNAVIATSPGTLLEAVGTVSCEDGYRLSGESQITCQADATWTTGPTCTIKDCGTPIINNAVVTTSRGTLFEAVGTVSCEDGYTLSVDSQITCQADASWTTGPTCTIKDCGTPSINNAVITTSPGTLFEAVGKVSCEDGYTLSGVSQITCQADATWTTGPTCTITDCGTPSINNAVITTSPGTLFEAVGTVSCEDGYILAGGSQTKCQADAAWTTGPICTIKDCGPPEILHAIIDTTVSGTVFGSVGTVSCKCMYILSGGTQITCQADASWSTGPTCTIIDASIHDCSEIKIQFPESKSCVFDVTLPVSGRPQSVYCDMETDGGGWTVFQRRQDGSVDFYLGWEDYVKGFGDPNGEFWIGLNILHTMTSNAPNEYELRIDLESFDGEKRYAKYDTFYIDGPQENYKLHVEGYNGDAGDSLMPHHNSMMFTTKDHDNDNSGHNCAVRFTGAWWYNACHRSNLNGMYHTDGTITNIFAKFVVWHTWKGFYVSLKKCEMKIKRKGYN